MKTTSTWTDSVKKPQGEGPGQEFLGEQPQRGILSVEDGFARAG